MNLSGDGIRNIGRFGALQLGAQARPAGQMAVFGRATRASDLLVATTSNSAAWRRGRRADKTYSLVLRLGQAPFPVDLYQRSVWPHPVPSRRADSLQELAEGGVPLRLLGTCWICDPVSEHCDLTRVHVAGFGPAFRGEPEQEPHSLLAQVQGVEP